jgi:hypothetical protein
MGYNNRQPASLDARLAVLCETIAKLRAGNSRDYNSPPASVLASGRDASDHFREPLSAKRAKCMPSIPMMHSSD